ncbi:MAG TPA: phosphoadenosine phosphosulfate reductase family protein [Flavobacteriaceae bacterium]|nr:phosphoadenosine phosphosulfate reductase family protein [Flavobacteriaceae bacterium]
MYLEQMNKELQEKEPVDIVKWVLNRAENPLITTNFRPYEVALLHLVTKINPDIAVVWCDTGYNTKATYQHVKELIELLDLNLKIYVPKQSVGFRNVMMGIPEVDTPEHQLFSEQVKLEPFKRAMKEHQPDYWFTNLRAGQTQFRDGIDILSKSKDGIIKVSPFYNFSDTELDTYLTKHDLPNEKDYYDPTKVLADRECGIHN